MEGRACCAPARDPVAPAPPAETPLVRRSGGATEGMRRIPAGAFLMGTEDADGWKADGEGPVREVALRAYWSDACCVTNGQFAEFVNATGHRTDAERYGWSFVFYHFLPRGSHARAPQRVVGSEWWCAVEGAAWRHPEGPKSNIKQRWDHPAVHISWRDAQAYAAWAGKRLPTEAEWERAARGGLVGKRYAWGDELKPEGRHRCNIWQGVFPTRNTAEDGYVGTAPAKSYRANGYGLYNVAGNVWEWCHDWFSADFHIGGPRTDPEGPPAGERKVIRGGSYLCHDSYCNRYRVGARTFNTPDSSTGNMGFRCARDE